MGLTTDVQRIEFVEPGGVLVLDDEYGVIATQAITSNEQAIVREESAFDPLLAKLHDDPRWSVFIEKIGLAGDL